MAQACALDQVPSISLDGHLAVINKQVPRTPLQLAHWAPFVFRAHPRVGQMVRFAENRREVARSLTKPALHHRILWRLGDGRSAFGWHISHAYQRSGRYRVTVLAYDQRSHRWYQFDKAIAVVRER